MPDISTTPVTTAMNISDLSSRSAYEFNVDTMYAMIERKDMSVLQGLGGISGIANYFQSDLSCGLSTSQVEHHRQLFGPNSLPQAETVTFLELVWENLGDPMMRILILAAMVSIVFGMTLKDPHTGEVNRATGWIEGTAILISVSLVVGVTATNDYNKAKKFAAMAVEQARKTVEVIRGGTTVSIDISELVVGDLMVVTTGQTLAADAILVTGHDLKMDESAATGETDVIYKRPDTDPFFISGTDVLEGDGLALVINVGVCSFAGKLAMSTRGSPSDTPLQVKLQSLAEMIGKLGLAASILTFLVLSLKDAILVVQGHAEFSITSYLNFLLVAITLVVVAIPEGLPLAVTIALAYSMKNMMRDNCLVRVLAACETMGGAKAICSDKTGTLTMNCMTVVEGVLAEEQFTVEGYSTAADPANAPPVQLGTAPSNISLLSEAICHNSLCQLMYRDGRHTWVGGNKTEHGLVAFVGRLGQNYQKIRGQVAADDKRTYPFSSTRKRMTTIVRCDGKFTVFVKGASELVLEDCDHLLTAHGVMDLANGHRSALQSIIERMGNDGNRTIAVAFGEMEGSAAFPEEEPIVPLTLIGILGLQDPIRAEVPGAIAACKQAGISVRMVTGDNRYTAVAVARKCGLLPPGALMEGEVMEGREFRRLAAEYPAKLHALLPHLRVLARSSPTDKLILVAYLMDSGDVVAVTGDGTNDAPALKLADVGFAMRSGTDVATGAAEMVLMDDNFATVVRAAVWGRTVNENIRKFLQFQLTVNVAGILFTLVGSALSEENTEPLKPVQLLWLNLIMDTLGALALATEAPADDCLTRPGSEPIVRDAPLISKRMWLFILSHATFQLAMIIFLTIHGPTLFDIPLCTSHHTLGDSTISSHCASHDVSQTIVFNVFIWMQLFNEFNARKLYGEKNPFEGLGRSKLFFLILLLCAAVQFCAVQFFGKFMATVPLTPHQWGLCIALASLEMPFGLLVACIPLRSKMSASDAADQKEEQLAASHRRRSQALSSMLCHALQRTRSGGALTREEMASLIKGDIVP